MGSVHGFEVESEVELARLGRAAGRRGTLRIATTADDPLDRPGELTAWDERDGVSFAIARCAGATMTVHCSATGDYLVDGPRTAVTVRAAAGVEPAWLEHRLLSVVVPLMLAERGDLVLHAAAVALDGRALLFAAPSGRGKSTLAAALTRAGAALIAEDGVVLDVGGGRAPAAWSGPRGVRLRAPGRSSAEHGFAAGLMTDGHSEPDPRTPVGALVLLRERGRDPAPAPLSPAVAAVRLAPALEHAGGPEGVRRSFALLAALAAAVPSYEVSLPDDLALLPAAAGALLERLSGLAPAAGALGPRG